jgi:hypothetical protein
MTRPPDAAVSDPSPGREGPFWKESTMSAKASSTRDSGRTPVRKAGAMSTTLIIGGATALGAMVGLVVGANIGGNWMTRVSLFGLNGYEATSTVGTVLGAVAFGVAGYLLARRR